MSRSFEVDCTVRVSHRPEDLSAHVELDGDIELHPGDEVRVHGTAITPRFGEERIERRRATVTRASALRRLWTRVAGDLACLSLIEVGFEERRTT